MKKVLIIFVLALITTSFGITGCKKSQKPIEERFEDSVTSFFNLESLNASGKILFSARNLDGSRIENVDLLMLDSLGIEIESSLYFQDRHSISKIRINMLGITILGDIYTNEQGIGIKSNFLASSVFGDSKLASKYFTITKENLLDLLEENIGSTEEFALSEKAVNLIEDALQYAFGLQILETFSEKIDYLGKESDITVVRYKIAPDLLIKMLSDTVFFLKNSEDLLELSPILSLSEYEDTSVVTKSMLLEVLDLAEEEIEGLDKEEISNMINGKVDFLITSKDELIGLRIDLALSEGEIEVVVSIDVLFSEFDKIEKAQKVLFDNNNSIDLIRALTLNGFNL